MEATVGSSKPIVGKTSASVHNKTMGRETGVGGLGRITGSRRAEEAHGKDVVRRVAPVTNSAARM